MAGKLAKRFRRQARSEASLRYDPEANVIRETARSVRSQARGDVRAARQSAKGAIRNARAARPAAEKSLGDALRAVSTTPSPTVAQSTLGAAAGRDAEGAQRRLQETKAGLDAELISREQDAAAGRTAAVRQARAVQGDELGKLSRQLRQVAAQRGVFTSGRVGELFESERGRRVQRRGQDKTLEGTRVSQRGQDRRSAADRESRQEIAEADRESREEIAEGKGKGGGRKRASQERVEAGQSALELARQEAQRLKASGRSRDEVLGLLVGGRESQTIKNDDKGNPLPNPVKVPGVSKTKDLWARAAVEIAWGGRVSQKTRTRLRALGYDLGSLGLGDNRPRSGKLAPQGGRKGTRRRRNQPG